MAAIKQKQLGLVIFPYDFFFVKCVLLPVVSFRVFFYSDLPVWGLFFFYFFLFFGLSVCFNVCVPGC